MDDAPALQQTIMFADIAGSTQLYDQLGDALAKQLVDTCIRLMGRIVAANDGQIVKTIGDEIMCRFDHPDCAVKSAICIEEAAATVPDLAANGIQLRIGLHHGTVIEEGRDLFGDAVNVAARMASQAKSGQIITTGQTRNGLSTELKNTSRLVDQANVKGKRNRIEIYEIAWGQPEEMTLMGTLTGQIVSSPASTESLMILDLDQQHISVSHDHPMVTMGRGEGNRIVIDNPKVSRLHARIEIRRNRFILIDQSTNGTYVQPDNGPMVLLRRDEIALDGEGTISLGTKVDLDSPNTIRYQRL